MIFGVWVGGQGEVFFNFWLCWVFIAVHRLLPLQSMGSRVHGLQHWHMGSAVAARGLSCLEACGILPDQGSNPCPLHWQADS